MSIPYAMRSTATRAGVTGELSREQGSASHVPFVPGRENAR